MFLKNIVNRVLFSQINSVSVFRGIYFSSASSFKSEEIPLPLRNRKKKSTKSEVKCYVDECFVKVFGGKGGDGRINFLHDWCKELGGPDGGDGGNGGHVLFRSTKTVKGLDHCKKIIHARAGVSGSGKDKTGRNATHTIINVPIGTIIKNEKGQVLADMNLEGLVFIGARGGAGGRGNKFFTNATDQAPCIAEFGADGEKKQYILEVKNMAHVGLLGFPNAGKSTLLRAITRARPKVEPYPFTTLNPHIGMVLYDDYEQIAVADLPGLIPDSHKNKGLGIQFLKHAERCCCLLYMLDTSVPEPWNQFHTLQYELSQFQPELLDRPKLLIANKMDLPEAQKNYPLLKEHVDCNVIPLSAKVGTNLVELLREIRRIYDERLNTSIFTQSLK